MKKLLIIIGVILLTSCVTRKPLTFYPNLIYTDYSKDSVFFVEFNRDGSIRHASALPINKVMIKSRK